MDGDIRPAFGDFPAGARIANYQINQLIGRGGMAVVYRATDVRLDRMVALKILSPDLARNDAFRQRFIRESRAGAAVDHPHVIPVFEAGDADGVLFIAMRYVAGQDVRALIEREGKLSAARTVDIVAQVASALDAAHAHGLVHRDVKPANMLLASVSDGSAADHVYLSDFGLSKQSLSLSSPSLTRTGQFLGTLDYMSPEQISGRAVDGKTDLYALACAAYEMLAGQPPFRRDANLAVMWAQISAEPPSVRQWRPELSPAVDEVIGKALAKSPEYRQASCADFAAELRAACGVGSAVQTPLVPPATELAYAVGAASEGARAAEPTVRKLASDSGRPAAEAPAAETPAAYQAGFAATSPDLAARGYAPSTQGYAASGPGGFGFQPEPPRRRGKAVPILVGCLVVVALAAAGVFVLHLRGSAAPQTGPRGTRTVTKQAGSASATASASQASQPGQTPAGLSGPAAVVHAFFRAVNHRDYARAWQLNTAAHSISSYTAFEQGYAQTVRDTVTITSVSGDIVSIDLASAQTNGSTKYYQGSYTVRNGVIVAASIRQVS